MITAVLSGTPVVKVDSEDERSHHAPVTGKPLLLQRIDAALEEGKKRGAFKSAREWSKKAGLSDNYVGVLRTRLQTGEVKQAKGEELTKLAGVLGYPVSYFLGSEDFAPIPRREVEPVGWRLRDGHRRGLPRVRLNRTASG